MIPLSFSWARFVAIVRKEFIQMRRDRLTFAMMFVMPILQLVLFGFAINSDPTAPIFGICEAGVVGDLHVIVPELTRRIRAAEAPKGLSGFGPHLGVLVLEGRDQVRHGLLNI